MAMMGRHLKVTLLRAENVISYPPDSKAESVVAAKASYKNLVYTTSDVKDMGQNPVWTRDGTNVFHFDFKDESEYLTLELFNGRNSCIGVAKLFFSELEHLVPGQPELKTLVMEDSNTKLVLGAEIMEQQDMGEPALLIVQLRKGNLQRITSVVSSRPSQISTKLTYKHATYKSRMVENVGIEFVWHEDNTFTFRIDSLKPDDKLRLEVYDREDKVGECEILMSTLLTKQENLLMGHSTEVPCLPSEGPVGSIEVAANFTSKLLPGFETIPEVTQHPLIRSHSLYLTTPQYPSASSHFVHSPFQYDSSTGTHLVTPSGDYREVFGNHGIRGAGKDLETSHGHPFPFVDETYGLVHDDISELEKLHSSQEPVQLVDQAPRINRASLNVPGFDLLRETVPSVDKTITSKDPPHPVNMSTKARDARVKSPRFSIRTRSDVDVLDDGFKWRKYGQKAVKNSPHRRNYYKCTAVGCPVRKRVERSTEDPGIVVTTYEGTHIHPVLMALDSTEAKELNPLGNNVVPFQAAPFPSLVNDVMGSPSSKIDLCGLKPHDELEGLLPQDLEIMVQAELQEMKGTTLSSLNIMDIELDGSTTIASGMGHEGLDLQPSTHLVDVLSPGNIKDISNDTIQSDFDFIQSLKMKMEALNFIQIIDADEAFSRSHPYDQSSIVLGYFNANNDHLEFYYESGETMARHIGVGLQHAKVIVKRGIFCEVQEIEKSVWDTIWFEVKNCSKEEFKIMKVSPPKTSDSIESGQFEGSYVASPWTPIYPQASFNTFQVPLLWELSKFFIMERVVNAFHTKCEVAIGGVWRKSFEANSMEDCPKDGNETDITWFQTLKVLFSKGQVNSNNNNGGNRGHENKQDGGGGNGDGNGGDDNFGGNSNVDLLVDKAYFTQVDVFLLSGGDFHEKNMKPLCNRHHISMERLSNVKITPELSFGFFKTISTRKIKVTTSVVFALNRDCDSIDSCGHFGWFHDEIHASFGPLDQNAHSLASRLRVDFREGEYISGKTINKASMAKDITKAKEKGCQVGLAIGSSQIARVAVGANVKQQASCMDHQNNEHSLESQCNQTLGGFKIQARPIMHKALLEYKYIAPYFEIVVDQIQDHKYRYDLSTHPMCNLQKTEFLGTWVPIGSSEVVEYAFKVDRRLHEIRIEEVTATSSFGGGRALFRKPKRECSEVHVHSTLEHPVTQAYQKQLYVNHAMTHLIDGQTYTLVESTNSQPLHQYLDAEAPLVRFPIFVD